jgi:hypothetical protein
LSPSAHKYGFGIRDLGSGKNLFRILDPGIKKAPDHGSGSTTLVFGKIIARLAQLMMVGTDSMAGFVHYVPCLLLQSELATQAGLTAALMGVLELLTPQHHVLLWRADCAVLGTPIFRHPFFHKTVFFPKIFFGKPPQNFWRYV